MGYIKRYNEKTVLFDELEDAIIDEESEKFITDELQKIGIINFNQMEYKINTVKEIFYYELFDIDYNGTYKPIFKIDQNRLDIIIPEIPDKYKPLELINGLIKDASHYMTFVNNELQHNYYETKQKISFEIPKYFRFLKFKSSSSFYKSIILISSTETIYNEEEVQEFLSKIRQYLKKINIITSSSYTLASTDKIYDIKIILKKFPKKINENFLFKNKKKDYIENIIDDELKKTLDFGLKIEKKSYKN